MSTKPRHFCHPGRANSIDSFWPVSRSERWHRDYNEQLIKQREKLARELFLLIRRHEALQKDRDSLEDSLAARTVEIEALRDQLEKLKCWRSGAVLLAEAGQGDVIAQPDSSEATDACHDLNSVGRIIMAPGNRFAGP